MQDRQSLSSICVKLNIEMMLRAEWSAWCLLTVQYFFMVNQHAHDAYTDDPFMHQEDGFFHAHEYGSQWSTPGACWVHLGAMQLAMGPQLMTVRLVDKKSHWDGKPPVGHFLPWPSTTLYFGDILYFGTFIDSYEVFEGQGMYIYYIGNHFKFWI